MKIFVFTFVHPFLYQIMKYGSHILCEHIMYTCRHGFKNRTRPAGPTSWTVGWSQFRFGPVTRLDGDQTGIGPLESAVQPVNQTNRPVLREPTGSMNLIFFFLKHQTTSFFSAYISKIKPNSLQPFLLGPPSAVTPTR